MFDVKDVFEHCYARTELLAVLNSSEYHMWSPTLEPVKPTFEAWFLVTATFISMVHLKWQALSCSLVDMRTVCKVTLER